MSGVEVATSEGRAVLVSGKLLHEVLRRTAKKVATMSQGEDEDAYDVIADVLQDLANEIAKAVGL